jgi:3-hydroxybutyryl-CoA dehydratase
MTTDFPSKVYDVENLRRSDIFVGQSASIDQVVEARDIDAFAALTGDVSPLHMHDSFARSRGFRGRVVHGMLLGGYISRLFGVHLPGLSCLLHSINLKWLKPVYVGDSLRFTATVTQYSAEAGVLVSEVTVEDRQSGLLLARGKVQAGFTGDTS